MTRQYYSSDPFICCYSHANNAKPTWDVSPLIPQELVPEERLQDFINSSEVSMKLLLVAFVGNSVVNNKDKLKR